MEQTFNNLFEFTFGSLATPILVLDETGIIKYINGACLEFIKQLGSLAGDVYEGANYLQVWDDEKNNSIQVGIKAVLDGKQDLFKFKPPLLNGLEQKELEIKVTSFRGESAAAVVTYESISNGSSLGLKIGPEGLKRDYELSFADMIGEEATEKKFLEGILDSIEGGISVIASDLTIRYTNRTIKEWHKNNLPLRGKKCFQAYHNLDEPCNLYQKKGCKICPTLIALETAQKETGIVELKKNSESKVLKVTSYPMYEKKTNHVMGVVEIIKDITEQKLMEEEIIASENKYRELFEASPLGILIIDKSGQIIEVNQALCEMSLYEKEELEGKSIYCTLVHNALKDATAEKICQVLQGQNVIFEGKAYNKLGEAYYFRSTGTEVRLADGRRAILSVITDISEQKELELIIKEKNKILKEELNKGKKIHQHLLPERLPEFAGVRMASIYRSAGSIGADFYQTIELEDKIIFYVSDITGHGLDGAFLNVFLRETINNFLANHYQSGEDLVLVELIEYINYRYRLDRFPDEYFISLLLFVMDKTSKKIEYINAGFHITPILVQSGKLSDLRANGPPISNAIEPKFYNFTQEEFVLAKGSTLVITTDGLIEEEIQGEFYGEERLREVVKKNYCLPPDILLNAIADDLGEFTAKQEPKDDITLLAVTNREVVDALELVINSSYKNIETVKYEMANFLVQYSREVIDILIGLHEVVANAVEHGNNKNYQTQVRVKATILKDSIVIEVEDEGVGFAWESELEQNLELTEIDGRGLGLALANKVFDGLSYNQIGNKAILYNKR